MFLLGQIVGGLVLVAVLTRGWLAFDKSPRNTTRLAVIHAAAYIVAVALYGWGNADGGPWNPGWSWIGYGIPAAVLFALSLRGRQRV